MEASTSKLILRERKFKTLFFLGLHLVFIAILIYLPNIGVSTVLAFVIYYLMEPLVYFLESKGVSRTLAAAIPFLTFALIFLLMGMVFVPLLAKQIDTLKLQLPVYSTQLRELARQVEVQAYPWLKEFGQSSAVETLQTSAFNKISGFFAEIPSLLSSSLTVLLLTPFFAFFLLHDGSGLYRNFLKIVPNHLFELLINVNHAINIQMGQFIRARLIETALITLFIFLGLTALQFPYSLIFSIAAGILSLVPYIGPIVATIPQIMLCVISPELRSLIAPIILLNLSVQIFDAVVLVPLLVARIVNLHPVIVVLAVIVGGNLLGVLGMIISIPLASAIKVFITAYYRYMTHSI
jgi:putative permease